MSAASSIASLPASQRDKALDEVAAAFTVPVEDLATHWEFWARPEQLLPDGDWRIAAYIAGRGAGKTRSGAEAIRRMSWRHRRTSLVGPTADDVRAVMVEGESGILNLPMKRHERPIYRPSLRRIYWPSGCVTRLFSADEPERLRGGQHEFVWCDEPASWRRPDAWAQIKFGTRIGGNPRIYVTGTPKPVTIIRDIYQDPAAVVIRGSSYDNRANLAPQWFSDLIKAYEGTRIGRQELHAELLLDIPGAVFTWESFRRGAAPDRGDFSRIVVALDPSGGDGEDHSEMGIVVSGKHRSGSGWVLADRSMRGTPDQVCEAVWGAFDEFEADVLVVEKNHGGDWIPALLRAHRRTGGAIVTVSASRAKRTRAEPIAVQYEQGRWWHVIEYDGYGNELPMPAQPLAALEDQMTSWVPDAGMESPDRMDAAVWAATYLGITGVPEHRRPRDADMVPAETKERITPRLAGVRRKAW